MLNIRLQEAEWNQVISIIAQAPWTTANPLLTAITRQLQEQKSAQQQTLEQTRGNSGGGTEGPAAVTGGGPIIGRH
jgi:hypothetical protein